MNILIDEANAVKKKKQTHNPYFSKSTQYYLAL